jgi:hypothetical protein
MWNVGLLRLKEPLLRHHPQLQLVDLIIEVVHCPVYLGDRIDDQTEGLIVPPDTASPFRRPFILVS